MKNLLLFLFSLFTLSLSAQNFIPLATDAEGDNTIGVDLTQVEIAASTDSLWFRLTAADSIQGDWGLGFGLDTNTVEAGGAPFVIYSDTQLLYDRKVQFYNNAFFPPTHVTLSRSANGMESFVHSDVNFEVVGKQIIIGLKMTDLDTDSTFNVVFGGGSFDGFFYDGVPNQGSISITPETFKSTSVSESLKEEIPFASINQMGNTLLINSHMTSKGEILNLKGQVVTTFQASEGSTKLNLKNLVSGMYIINLSSIQGLVSKKIVIQE